MLPPDAGDAHHDHARGAFSSARARRQLRPALTPDGTDVPLRWPFDTSEPRITPDGPFATSSAIRSSRSGRMLPCRRDAPVPGGRARSRDHARRVPAIVERTLAPARDMTAPAASAAAGRRGADARARPLRLGAPPIRPRCRRGALTAYHTYYHISDVQDDGVSPGRPEAAPGAAGKAPRPLRGGTHPRSARTPDRRRDAAAPEAAPDPRGRSAPGGAR